MAEQVFVKLPDLVTETFYFDGGCARCDGCFFEDSPACTHIACEPSEREDGRHVIFKRKEAING